MVGLGNVGKPGRTCGVGGGRAGAPSWSEDSRISRLRMGSVYAKICMYGPSSPGARLLPPRSAIQNRLGEGLRVLSKGTGLVWYRLRIVSGDIWGHETPGVDAWHDVMSRALNV